MRSLALILLVAAACRDADRPEPAFERRFIPADVLARKAIAYSGYRAGQSPDVAIYPSEAEIEEDLRLLVRGGWGVIRLFDAGPHAERVLRVIDRTGLDLKVLQGAWIAGAPAQHDAANRDQLARAVALVEAHPDTIVAVSVGNETLDDWSNVRVAPAALAGDLAAVRGEIALPVTTDDAWLPFALGQDGATSYADVIEVARAADLLSLHVYAFADAYYDGWDWQQAAAHPVNQRIFHDAFTAWVYGDARDADRPAAAFTFEAFDEPWKAEWGDDDWGLFDVDRRARPVVWDLFPGPPAARRAGVPRARRGDYRP